MRFLAVVLLPILANAAYAISACGVCGASSGVMCIDDTTFSFCDYENRKLPGRHSCPQGMVCVDNFAVCVNATAIPEGTAICESMCGKCGDNNRFACRSKNTFSLCFGTRTPNEEIFKCPTNQVCSTTRDPTSRQFCFDEHLLSDEEVSCFGSSSNPSSVFARFIAGAAK